MKQVWPNYSYSPATNVLTLTGLNIDRNQLLLVAAPERGRIMYNFADSSVTASSFTSGANTSLTLVASTAGLTTTASLVIYYDDQLQGNSVTISSLPSISGTVTANTRNNGISNDPWVYIPRLTMSHPDVGDIILDGYYRFDGENTWGPPNINASYAYLLRIDERSASDQWIFVLYYNDEANDQLIELAIKYTNSPDFPTSMDSSAGTLVSGSLTFNTEQRESYSVRVNNSVTIGSCVTHGVTIANSSVNISGTVTANTGLTQPLTDTQLRATAVPVSLASVPTHAVTLASTTVTVSSLPALSAGTAQIGSVTANISGTVPVSGTFWQATQPVSGTVTVSSTTVTVSALPSGALTTRFGSVTTGGTSQLTSCVTNTNRKYLLCQNIDTTTVTIGIGFSPTTTQGIQLAPGAGISFDAFCPTGAVWWLGATNANFNILEG